MASSTPNVLEFRHRAMACDFVVLVPDGSVRAMDSSGMTRPVADVVLDSLERVDRIESALTVYRDDSEIALVNREASRRPVPVSAATFALLQRSLELHRLTDGAFDITAGPLVDAWGFGQRQGRKPDSAEIAAALAAVGAGLLTLNPFDRSVKFARDGMRLNLGAIGKGEAIDHLTSELRQRGVADFLIHAGNSSVFASGRQFALSQDRIEGQDPELAADDSGWLIGIAHPTKPARRVGGIRLSDAALGTSGSGTQFFHHRGQRYGHVIDPRDGQPAGDLLSLSVITPRAVDADALATGLFVLGRERAAELSTEHGWPLMTIAGGDRHGDLEIATVGDWPVHRDPL